MFKKEKKRRQTNYTFSFGAVIEIFGVGQVVLKESSSPHDMLKALFQVNYLYWLEKNVGLEERSASNDCRNGGRLQISLEYVEREFNHVKTDGDSLGWVMDGLIARPLPNRIRLEHVVASSIAS